MIKNNYLLGLLTIALLTGCVISPGETNSDSISSNLDGSSFPSSSEETYDESLKYRTFYQILVYSFADSDGDGRGDFKGIADKIPYLKALGIEGIYLSPIHPSSSYHGYDVTDYYGVKSIYEVGGYTFDNLITDLAQENIVVVIDLVVNHSSRDHLWFFQAQDAYSRNEDNPYIAWYNFSRTQSAKYTWGSNNAFYEGIFSSSMPDFDFDNLEVRQEFINIGKYWMNRGVTGFRLDAAMHIFTDYSGGDKWNGDIYDKNVDFWREFKREIAKDYPQLYMIGEVWTSTPKLERYYATNIDSLFNFDHAGTVQGQLTGTASLSTRFAQHQFNIRNQQATAIESYFLSNHDKARISSSLTNLNWLKMMGAMTILAPGNSFIYYGEEVGLKAVGSSTIPDRMYRTPMPWATNDGLTVSGSYGNGANLTSTTASGQSVAVQMTDPLSLLVYYQELIRMKSAHFEVKAGQVTGMNSGNNLVSVHRVNYQGTISLIIHNAANSNATYTSSTTPLAIKDSLSPSLVQATLNGSVITLPPYSSTIVALS
jgi:glycosidase